MCGSGVIMSVCSSWTLFRQTIGAGCRVEAPPCHAHRAVPSQVLLSELRWFLCRKQSVQCQIHRLQFLSGLSDRFHHDGANHRVPSESVVFHSTCCRTAFLTGRCPVRKAVLTGHRPQRTQLLPITVSHFLHGDMCFLNLVHGF